MQDDTRNRILEASGRVFAEKGYEKATIREIAGLAGVNLAGVNYHFGDKSRLYAQAIVHAHRLRMEQAPLPEWSLDTPPQTRLRDFIRTLLERMLGLDAAPWQHQLITREMLQPTGACRQLIEDSIRPEMDVLDAILDDLVPAGTPPHRRRQLAFSIIGQCVFYRFHREVISLVVPPDALEAHFTPPLLAEHISNLVLAAMGCETFASSSQHSLVLDPLSS